MVLALGATASVVLALLWEILVPRLEETLARRRARRARVPSVAGYDPGRERRAEQRARALLRSCVNQEEWEMYRDLGFIRVIGQGPRRRSDQPSENPAPGLPGEGSFSFLIYPHKPIVAYVPQTRRLLSEYCVEFPDLTGAISQQRLPDSDDVLAKWMLIRADEERLLRGANMHLPGRQVDPQRVRRDLWRLRQWERERQRRESRRDAEGGTVSAS